MRTLVLLFAMILSGAASATQSHEVKIKDVARIAGVRENALTGYGLVFGLSGSGDSARNRATVQSVANTLRNFGVAVELSDLSSRNVAAVLVTAKLPPFAEPGQPLDVQVSSAGDARSLTGGTLMLVPLAGPDGKIYAVAQGAISVGGYQFEAVTASVQKNHPTVGWIPSGATVERAAPLDVVGRADTLSVLLDEADFTTANRIAQAINASVPGSSAVAEHAGKVLVRFNDGNNRVARIAQIENVLVARERPARVVINERTGTIVAGGDIRVGQVSISHGDLRVEISTRYSVSQPDGLLVRPGPGVRSVLVPESTIKAEEGAAPLVKIAEGATVAELISALRVVKLSTRDVIAVLQSIKSAGALDGELVIQ